MAARLRLKRMGSKNRAVFRVVVADNRGPRDGRFIEELGTYKPIEKSDPLRLNLERTDYWLQKGAQPSDTVASLIKQARRQSTQAA